MEKTTILIYFLWAFIIFQNFLTCNSTISILTTTQFVLYWYVLSFFLRKATVTVVLQALVSGFSLHINLLETFVKPDLGKQEMFIFTSTFLFLVKDYLN